MRMTKIALAVLLACVTPASARSWMQWDCGDNVQVTLYVSVNNSLHRTVYSTEIGGLRDPEKDRVTFKEVRGYARIHESSGKMRLIQTADIRAYLNGKRCHEVPYGESPAAATCPRQELS